MTINQFVLLLVLNMYLYFIRFIELINWKIKVFFIGFQWYIKCSVSNTSYCFWICRYVTSRCLNLQRVGMVVITSFRISGMKPWWSTILLRHTNSLLPNIINEAISKSVLLTMFLSCSAQFNKWGVYVGSARIQENWHNTSCQTLTRLILNDDQDHPPL